MPVQKNEMPKNIMLAKTNADVVVLATPSGLHPTQAIEAAKAGFHVMTEEPMATRWADGLRMVEACDRAGVGLFVIKQNRFNATQQLLCQAVANQGGLEIHGVADSCIDPVKSCSGVNL